MNLMTRLMHLAVFLVTIMEQREKQDTIFSSYKSMGLFKTLKGSLLRSHWPYLAEIGTHALVFYFYEVFESDREKTSSGFSTRSNTNQAVQPLKMFRGLKFQI